MLRVTSVLQGRTKVRYVESRSKITIATRGVQEQSRSEARGI